MSLYYEDEFVQLHHGRAEDVLPTLNPAGSVHLLTDPPYFGVKDDDWDNQWSHRSEFLDWMSGWLDLVRPLLSVDASIWVFASPDLTSAVEAVVAEKFRVLNSVRWVKEQGWHRRTELATMRSFLSPWEGIVFAEMRREGDAGLVSASIGAYLRAERERSGKPLTEVQALFPSASGNITGAVSNWELGYNMPSSEQYERIRGLLGKSFLRREYEDLRREYEDLRRPFFMASREHSMDVWFFDSVAAYPGKHPCEKPTGLLTHMIEATTRPGDTIIDPFAGSGAVLDAARMLGRKAIGIEMDSHWCSHAARRLSQQAFDFSTLTPTGETTPAN